MGVYKVTSAALQVVADGRMWNVKAGSYLPASTPQEDVARWLKAGYIVEDKQTAARPGQAAEPPTVQTPVKAPAQPAPKVKDT